MAQWWPLVTHSSCARCRFQAEKPPRRRTRVGPASMRRPWCSSASFMAVEGCAVASAFLECGQSPSPVHRHQVSPPAQAQVEYLRAKQCGFPRDVIADGHAVASNRSHADAAMGHHGHYIGSKKGWPTPRLTGQDNRGRPARIIYVNRAAGDGWH